MEARKPIAELAREAVNRRRCDLWRDATQTVFGDGPEHADMVLIGEQPGDREGVAGRPFVGPAGRVLDAAPEEAGIVRNDVCVTNAVKHFKFEPRGKRRIHHNPSAEEINACRWWLDHEQRRLHPNVVVLRGASAARAELKRTVTVSRSRGRPMPLGETAVIMTIHPPWLPCMPDAEAKARRRMHFVADLRVALDLTR